MNFLTKFQSTSKAPQSLEELLAAMCKYGKPSLFMLSGWHCAIEMHVASKGTQFKIASEFNHKTPIEAAQECHRRIVSTLADLGL